MSRKVGITANQENDTTMNDLDDLHARPDPYVELVWENGQVIMQGQPNDQPNSDISQGITDAIESKTIRLTAIESVSGNFPLPATSTDTGLYQNGEMARWLDYSIREPTLDDYTAQLLHDLSGATFNDLPLENILPSKERKSNFNGNGSRNTDNSSVDERDHVISLDSVCKASSSMCAFTNMRLQRLNSGPGTSSRVTNFCHIRSLGGGSSNDLTKLDNNEHRGNTPNDASPKKVHVGENNVERVVAISSVCSGNSGERGSSQAERYLKRKSRENGDSDGPSEEHESGSVGATQVSTVRKGAKRNRAAEVHNLSERRRRDRINEKMRALQELIPNCNKADKASMLDEAIEYLKTLQNQVQMLSVGPGMYVPPVALPHGMQHLNGACIPQSSHVLGGMNMGMNMMNMNMGYGMNMFNNLNNGLKFTSFQGQQQFLGQQNPISAQRIYQGMSNSGLTIGHPCPIQGVPGLPVSGALTLKIPIESNFLGMGAIAAATHSAPSSSQEVGSQVTMPVPNVIDSVSQPSVQTSNESIVRAVPSNDQSQTRNA